MAPSSRITIFQNNQSVLLGSSICIDTNMKDIDIQIDNLDFTKPISFYSNFYGLSENAIRNRFRKLGIYKKFLFTKGHVSSIKSKLCRKKYSRNPKICPQCKSIIPYESRGSQYCSLRCSSIYTQKDGGHCHWSSKDKKRISIWAKMNAYRHPKNGKYKLCPNCKNEFYLSPSKEKGICCSKKCYTLWCRDTGYLKGKGGGLRHGSGRGKMGWYKGYYCNSSWELAWVIFQLENGIAFTRNTCGFEYELDGKKHKFYPDFIVDKNKYVEIKGYIDRKNKAKILSFPFQLEIISKKEIVPYIQYVEQKYGKDFTRLYE